MTSGVSFWPAARGFSTFVSMSEARQFRSAPRLRPARRRRGIVRPRMSRRMSSPRCYPPLCQRIEAFGFTPLSFDETFVSRNDARCSAVCAIASSLRSGIVTFDLAGILGDTWVFSRNSCAAQVVDGCSVRSKKSVRIPSTTLRG